MRLVMLLLVGLGIALYVPRTRDILMGYAMPVLNPALRWQTLHEMGSIADEVAFYERENPGQIPPANAFPGWLQRNFTPGAAQDSWGGTYRLFLEAQTFEVVSWGPDRKPRTADDLRVARKLSGTPR